MQIPRRTTLVATIGPVTDSPEMLEKLIRGGMDVARLNMSHAKPDWVRATVAVIRDLSRRLEQPVGILMDIQGPAIRTGAIPAPIALIVGQTVIFTVIDADVDASASPPRIGVNYPGLVGDVNVGDRLLLDNGQIQMRTVGKLADQLVCRVDTAATLGSRRHINLPGVRVSLPALTAKDREDVALAVEVGADFLGLSFCRRAEDVQELRDLIHRHGGEQMIVAKIENRQGIDNLEAIAAAADGIMAARGDLGIECPYEDLPYIQEQIVRTCSERGKPVIVATQMLSSMVHSPYPSRAEITDVAHAVHMQGDAIMLSDETSVGAYPLRCLEVMDTLARRGEREAVADFARNASLDSDRARLVKAACVLAADLEAPALMVFTQTGRMARNVAWQRPRGANIYAFTNNRRLLPQLSLQWGTTPFHLDFGEELDDNVATATAMLRDRGYVRPGDDLVLITEIRTAEGNVNTIQMRTVPAGA